MVTGEEQRARLVPTLAKLLRNRDFRIAMAKAADEEHGFTIIPVLPDDRMSYVFRRLREADDRGIVATFDGGKWDLAILWPASSARVTVAREDDSIAQIHCDSEVSMFFGYLKQRETVVVEELAARLMPRGQLQLM
jgi:hypothetical protein